MCFYNGAYGLIIIIIIIYYTFTFLMQLCG